jgi:hypothetical protein
MSKPVPIHDRITTMKKPLLSLILALCSLACAAAPASDESIRTLFKIMKTEALLDSIYAGMEPAMRQAVARQAEGKPLSDEQRRFMERMPQRISEILRSELSWAAVEPMQVAVYRESFEQAEIDALIAFYRSPVGQAFINKMPAVTQKAMAAMQTHMQQVIPRIEAAVQRLVEEAKLAPGR